MVAITVVSNGHNNDKTAASGAFSVGLAVPKSPNKIARMGAAGKRTRFGFRSFDLGLRVHPRIPTKTRNPETLASKSFSIKPKAPLQNPFQQVPES